MTLESIIRPFVSPRPLNTRRVIPSSTKKEPQTAGVTWGKVGKLPSARQSDADGPAVPENFKTETKKTKVRQVETSRKTETVRIEQPGNPANYVDVQRVTAITFGQAGGGVALMTSGGASKETVAYARPPGSGSVSIDSLSISASASKSKSADGLVQLDPTEYELKPPT